MVHLVKEGEPLTSLPSHDEAGDGIAQSLFYFAVVFVGSEWSCLIVSLLYEVYNLNDAWVALFTVSIY